MRPSIKQDEQVANSDLYDDSKQLGSLMEPQPRASSLENDLNNIRSVIAEIKSNQAGNWFDPSPRSLVDVDSSLSGINWTVDKFSPSDGQVTFLLTSPPSDVDSIMFKINGIYYDSDYVSVSGQTVTWSNNGFAIDSSDSVVIQYR